MTLIGASAAAAAAAPDGSSSPCRAGLREARAVAASGCQECLCSASESSALTREAGRRR